MRLFSLAARRPKAAARAGLGAALATLVVVTSVVASPAAAAVRVSAGRLSPNGFALVSGSLPHGVKFTPRSFALSKDSRFSRNDVVVGAAPRKARRGRFTAWVALPDAVATGRFRLLACRRRTPSRSSCRPAGAVRVKSPPAIPAATPTADPAHTATGTFDMQGGSISLTAADGATYVLTVPQNAVPNLTVTMTAVSSLTPASAVGTLVDGVMIDPAGSAPPGTTLEIKRSSVPRGAREVAFGGADPSGGAFPLPGRVTADTTVPVMGLGGYGVAVAAAGHAADVVPRHVPCDQPAADIAAAGSRPLMSCITAAERMRQLSDSAFHLLVSGGIAAVAPVFQAAASDLASEMGKITSLPPTDEGEAELEQLLILAIGVDRQAQLMGLQDSVAAMDGYLYKAALYYYNLVKSKCMGAGQTADVYIEFLFDAIAADRQFQLLGGPTGDIFAIEQACVSHIKIQLNGKIDATTDNSVFTEHVIAHATATITGAKDTLNLESNDPALVFDTASSQADPSFASYGGSATTISKQGNMYGGTFTVQATKRIRCDKNRQFVIERHAFLYIHPFGLWADAENVQLAVNGTPAGTEPAAAASQAWANDYSDSKQRFEFELGGQTPNQTISKSDSGACNGMECQTYSYSATLDATPQTG